MAGCYELPRSELSRTNKCNDDNCGDDALTQSQCTSHNPTLLLLKELRVNLFDQRARKTTKEDKKATILYY